MPMLLTMTVTMPVSVTAWLVVAVRMRVILVRVRVILVRVRVILMRMGVRVVVLVLCHLVTLSVPMVR